MTAPLTAGERLMAPPPSNPDPSPRGPVTEPPRKARRSSFRWLARAAGAALGFVLLSSVLALVVAYGAYRHFAADLPDVEGLRSYQPRVMSRVYAGDARPIAELATERRIFVPYAAIPELLKQAFVSAEDQNFWV